MWVEGWGQLPGQLVVISGPSGCGKSSILRSVLKTPDLNVRLSVSATTREPRPGETPGADYEFMDADEFLAARDRGEFLEYADYNQRFYGTPATPVYEALSAGMSVLLEIEVNGALQIRQHAPSALFVFVKTPSFRDLEERLRKRGTETEDSTLRRLRKAREELAEAHWYDEILINDDFDACVTRFITLLKNYQAGG